MLQKHVPSFLQLLKKLFLIYHEHHSVYRFVFRGPEKIPLARKVCGDGMREIDVES